MVFLLGLLAGVLLPILAFIAFGVVMAITTKDDLTLL